MYHNKTMSLVKMGGIARETLFSHHIIRNYNITTEGAISTEPSGLLVPMGGYFGKPLFTHLIRQSDDVRFITIYFCITTKYQLLFYFTNDFTYTFILNILALAFILYVQNNITIQVVALRLNAVEPYINRSRNQRCLI